MKYILILLVSCLIYSASSAQIVTYTRIKNDMQNRYLSSTGDTVSTRYSFMVKDSTGKILAFCMLGLKDTIILDQKGLVRHYLKTVKQ